MQAELEYLRATFAKRYIVIEQRVHRVQAMGTTG